MSPLARQDSPNTPTSAEPELDKDQMRAVAQVQRWHDFKAHLGAYLLINAVLIIVWAVTGGGTFWPGISLAAWGRGLSSRHFLTPSRRSPPSASAPNSAASETDDVGPAAHLSCPSALERPMSERRAPATISESLQPLSRGAQTSATTIAQPPTISPNRSFRRRYSVVRGNAYQACGVCRPRRSTAPSPPRTVASTPAAGPRRSTTPPARPRPPSAQSPC